MGKVKSHYWDIITSPEWEELNSGDDAASTTKIRAVLQEIKKRAKKEGRNDTVALADELIRAEEAVNRSG